MDPGRLIVDRLSRRGDRLRIDLDDRTLWRPVSRVRVVGAGKAAAAMVRAVAAIVPEASGVVVAPRDRPGSGRSSSIGQIRLLPGDHPIPGRASFESTAALLRAVERFPPDATILFLLSGGASALLAAPAQGLTRADKVALNRHLLRCGASIEVMNAVRKHVSAVKGGRLAVHAAGREVITLALSDVPGDDLATIGSGPAVGDPTTFADALHGLRGDEAALPPRIRRHLAAGAAGEREETPVPGDRRLRRCRAVVIGCNDAALAAAAERAQDLGYTVRRDRKGLYGEAAERGRLLARSLPPRPLRATCVLAGGETFVTAAGSSGRGGRCQEMAIAAAAGLAGSAWTVLFAGTDGRDGRTVAAGGFADGTTAQRAHRRPLAAALDAHDSHPLLRSLGDLLRTGPTGTNVMDVAIAVHPGAARARHSAGPR